jgi:hypothetical protein
MKKMIIKMLETSIIQNNTSPFASPVVLVKKKDHFGDFVWIIRCLISSILKISISYL